MYSDNTWISPGIKYTRGGVTDNYSVRITQDCHVCYSPPLPSPPPIMMITDIDIDCDDDDGDDDRMRIHYGYHQKDYNLHQRI